VAKYKTSLPKSSTQVLPEKNRTKKEAG